MAFTIVGEDVAESLATMEGASSANPNWWIYLTQLPLVIYFLVSLVDTPIDLAVQRLLTCYLLPFFLLFLSSLSTWYALFLLVVLWFLFTKSVPFAPIRVPSGVIRRSIRRSLQRSFLGHLVKEEVEDEAVNPFAITAYIDLIKPIVQLVNNTGRWAFGPPPSRLLEVSEVGWLFLTINWLARHLQKILGFKVIFPLAWRALRSRARHARQQLALEHDETEKGVALFLNDLDRKGSPVSATGRLLMNNLFQGMLDVRLTVQKYIKKHPAVLKVPLRAPIIIIGLPRTGSTFLLSLLAQDPDCRHLRFWEMNMPIPLSEPATYRDDPRIAQMDMGMAAIELVCPTYLQDCAKNHVIAGNTIEEELLIIHQGFCMFSHYFLLGPNSAYKEWFFQPNNKKYVYKYLRIFLQLLSYKHPPRNHWVLKAPIHSLYIDTLLAEFPDAHIINTHRDPLEVISSWTRFQTQMLSIYCESSFDGTKEFAALTTEMLKIMVDRVMEYRAKLDPEKERKQFFDVRIEDLSSDPIGMVKKIYAHFGLTFTEAFESALAVYIAENGTGDGGKPKPHLQPQADRSAAPPKKTIEDFGLNREATRRMFEDYVKLHLPPKTKN